MPPSDRAAAVLGEHELADAQDGDRPLRDDLDGLALVHRRQLHTLPADGLLDAVDRRLGLLGVPVSQLPAGALGDVAPDVDDDQAEDGPDEEADAPAPEDRHEVRVQQHQSTQRADQGAGPVRPVDRDVDPAAEVRRDELVDRGVDGGVLAADAEPRDEPEHQERTEVPRQAAEPAAHQVDDEREDEQAAPAEPVGQTPEHQSADHLADQVRGGQEAHLRGRDPESALRLGEDRADVGHQLDLEAVEDPRHPEADDDHPMEPRPRQPVQPCRYQAAHGLRRRCGCTHLGPLSCWLVGLACAAAACGAAAKTLRGTAVNLPSTTSAISGAPSVQFSFASTPYTTCASRYFSSGSLGAFPTGRMLDPAAASPHSRSRSTCGRSPWEVTATPGPLRRGIARAGCCSHVLGKRCHPTVTGASRTEGGRRGSSVPLGAWRRVIERSQPITDDQVTRWVSSARIAWRKGSPGSPWNDEESGTMRSPTLGLPGKSPKDLCARGDLNPHALSDTGT